MRSAVKETHAATRLSSYRTAASTIGSAADELAIGPLNPQQWFGVTHPVDPQNDFVITPLRSQQAPSSVGTALKLWDTATSEQQTTWATNYDTAITAARGDLTQVADGKYGPSRIWP